MLNAFFVSDVHLDWKQEPRCRLFLDFLKKLEDKEDVTHLFMVGDIFDLWVGDHHYLRQQYSQIISALVTLKDRGVEIHYFEGNHDLHLSRFWQKELGFAVHKGPEIFKLGPYQIRVEHGDEVDPDDRGYLFLRWFLRTSPMRFLAFHLPGFLLKQLGEWASRQSRRYTSESKAISEEESLKKLRAHGIKVSREPWFGRGLKHSGHSDCSDPSGQSDSPDPSAQPVHSVQSTESTHSVQSTESTQPIDFLISGHIHVRCDEQVESVRVINLGTWLDRPCYFQLSEKRGQFVDL